MVQGINHAVTAVWKVHNRPDKVPFFALNIGAMGRWERDRFVHQKLFEELPVVEPFSSLETDPMSMKRKWL